MPDSDAGVAPKTMATGASGSQTVLHVAGSGGREGAASPAVLKLKLKKPPPSRRVQWTEDTVDNEHMNKKKSKCCCVYKKPLKFGESESEDSDSDCEHCSHHTPKDFVAARDGEGNRRDDETNESKNDGEGHGASVDSAAPSGYSRRTRKSCYESKEAEERKIERDLLERGREESIAECMSEDRNEANRNCNSSNVTLYPASNGYPRPQLRNENASTASSNSGASSSTGVVSFCRRATRKNTQENSKSDFDLTRLPHPLALLPPRYFHLTFPRRHN